MAGEKFTVETTVQAPINVVWTCFTDPEHIMRWNHASEDWHCPRATNDAKTGGTFSYRMEARDGSIGFDLVGTYDEVVPDERIAYTMGDGRKVVVVFVPEGSGVHVVETAEAEGENPVEMQRTGWQSILNNFKTEAESH